MDNVVAFIAGAVAAIVILALARRRATPAVVVSPEASAPATAEREEPRAVSTPEPEPVAPVPQPVALDPPLTLPMLGELLESVGDGSSHPSEVENHPTFKAAVEIFETLPMADVLGYVSGRDWMLASAALAALPARTDGSSEVAALAVVTAFKYLRPWPAYFALKYLALVRRPSLPGTIILGCPDWWADHPFMPALLSDYFRAFRGTRGTFDGALDDLDEDELKSAEKLLPRINHQIARDLGEEIAAFRFRQIDRAFLQTVGRFVELDASRTLLVEHPVFKEPLDQAEAAIFQRPARSVLVVGEAGSGRTSLLTLLGFRARKKGWAIFEATGPQVQAGQVYIGELEERLRRLTAELDSAKRVVWHVPDFVQFAVSGTHKGQTASILEQIMPAVSTGRVILMSVITPAELTRLLQQRPGLRTVLELVRLRSLDESETAALAREVAARMAARQGMRVDDDALEFATHASRHYLAGDEMPGALLDLLKLAAKRVTTRGQTVLTRADVLATVTQLTGMPIAVLDDRERVDLTRLRGFFTSRVIGQTEAIDAVVDRIAMFKAGLTDPGKPAGVFLFAGPTGTGKTELAKTLASYLFGSDDRMIRLDMSEFQTADAVRKIIGDPLAGDSSQSLTEQVRRQPFSVVLLDEFEKSHPNIWDLFLQVFDDGRLADANGHTVDFRHCIVILTSNIGSTIRQDSGPGFVAQDHSLSEEKVHKAINQSFRPEFVNRLDRIIVFRPLTREHMRRIVEKELGQVFERRGLRNREWAVEWEASALEFLLDRGFSPAMGARPLKRAIDEYLLAPLAATLVEHRFPEGDQFLFVRSDGRALQVEFVDPDTPPRAERAEAEPVPASAALSIPRIMLHPSGTAAEWQTLSAELARLESEVASERWASIVADLAARMQHADFWNRPDRPAVLSRFEVMDRVKAALLGAAGLARRVERSADASRRYSRDLMARLASQLFVVRHGIEDALDDAPVEAAIAVQAVLDRGDAAAAADWRDRLAGMYRSWAAVRGMRIESERARDPRGIVVSGFGAWRLLAPEAGLHVLEYSDRGEPQRAVARVMVGESLDALGSSGAQQVVRRYQLEPSPMVRDTRQGWRTGRVDLVLKGHFDVLRDIYSPPEES